MLESRTLLTLGQLDPGFGNAGWVTTDFTSSDDPGSLDGIRAVAMWGDRVVAVGGDGGQIARYLSNGVLDTTFGSGGLVYAHNLGTINDVLVLSDGKILIVGRIFKSDLQGNDQGDFGIVRLKVDGTLDTSFGDQGALIVDILGLDDEAKAICLIPNSTEFYVAGTAEITGEFIDTSVDPPSYLSATHAFAVVKMQSNGTLDTGFDGDGIAVVDFSSRSVTDATAFDVQVDSQTLATGNVLLFGSAIVNGRSDRDFAVARLTSNGAKAAFSGLTDEVILTDFGGNQTKNDEALSGLVLADGTIVAGGYSGAFDVEFPNDNFALAAYTSTGLPKPGFGTNGQKTVDFSHGGTQSRDRITHLSVQTGDVLVAAGLGLEHEDTNPRQRMIVRRFNANNTTTDFTGSFFAPQQVPYSALTVDSNQKLVVGGIAGDATDFGIVRLQAANMQLDTSFDGDGVTSTDFTPQSDVGSIDQIHALVRLPSGKFFAAGGTAGQIARYNSNGMLDTTFGDQGLAIVPGLSTVNDAVLRADGTLLLVGQIFTELGNGDFGAVNITTDGDLVDSFGSGGIATADFAGAGLDDEAIAVTLLAGDAFLCVGYAATNDSQHIGRFGVARFLSNGQLDPGFNGNGKRTIDMNVYTATARDVLVDSLGRIVLVGSAQLSAPVTATDPDVPGFHPDFAVARILANGGTDTSFNGTSFVRIDFGSNSDDEGFSGVLTANDGVIAAGYSRVFKAGRPDDEDFALIALTNTGIPDSSFGPQGRQSLDFADRAGASNDRISQIAQERDGQIVAVGTASDQGPLGARQRMVLARFNTNGTVDKSPNPETLGRIYASFNLSQGDSAQDLIILPDGKWLVGGTTSDAGNFGLAQFQGDDNHPPVILNQVFSLPENSTFNTVVGTAAASDPDDGDTLNWSITAGNSSGSFTIDQATGQIRVANPTALNFEANPSFPLTVSVKDTLNATTTATITVNLTNVNESPVVQNQTFSVPENSAVNTPVGSVIASDPDQEDVLTWEITAGNGLGAFAINPTTGLIRVANAAPLNFETTSSFTLTVSVKDALNVSAFATVTVNLTNVNESPVVQNQTFSVPENSAVNTAVGSVVASDPDQGDVLTWAITAGNGSGVFAINTTTGQITVANSGALDFETTPSFSLTVSVTDNHSETTSATITVNVTAANKAPVIQNQTFSVPENSAVNTPVGSVIASDPDQGDVLTWAITAGNGLGAFAINPATGLIRVANTAPLNFETTPSFALTISVKDALNATSFATVTVNLTNVNESPVVPNQIFSVPENSAVNTPVGSVIASDPDQGNVLTWAITAGNGLGAFAINPATGLIRVANTAPLNFEMTPSFSLAVSVTDNHSETTAATITVNLTDVNEAPSVTNRVPSPGSTITSSATPIDVTFSESVTGVDATDLVLSGSAAGGATKGTPVNQGANTWRFPVTGLVNGTLNVSLAPDANDIENVAGDDLANVTWTYTVAISTGGTQTSSNTANIEIVDNNIASPYPSNIIVSGMSGAISDVNVTLTGLTHTFGIDLDILLVGPGGQSVLLMSDAGGIATLATLTFDDAGSAFLPQSGPLVSGTFRPTNYGGADSFPAPAPAGGPSGTALSVFDSTDPNGTWQLFVVDDEFIGAGSISGGWSLTITTGTKTPTLNPIPDPAPIDKNAGQQSINLTGITAGAGESEVLRITAVSSNTAVIPNPTANYVSPNSTGSLTYTPVANRSGISTVTVTVTDTGADGVFDTSDDRHTDQTFNVVVVDSDSRISDNSPQPVYIRRHSPVSVIPNAIATGSSFNGATLTISMSVVQKRSRTFDSLSLSSAFALGTVVSSGSFGEQTWTIALNSNVTASSLQSFLRNIRFSTTGKGFTQLSRFFSVTLSGEGLTTSSIFQTILVRKR